MEILCEEKIKQPLNLEGWAGGKQARLKNERLEKMGNWVDGLLHLPPKQEYRFWKRTDKKAAGGCWLWDSRNKFGYGIFFAFGLNHQAHRISFMMHKGKIPNDKLICHKCDIRNCVNPAHLWLGSHSDNMHDMIMKGRQALGERHFSAKLSKKEVLAAKSLYETGKYTKPEIARFLRVGVSTIHSITKGINWKHIPSIDSILSLEKSLMAM